MSKLFKFFRKISGQRNIRTEIKSENPQWRSRKIKNRKGKRYERKGPRNRWVKKKVVFSGKISLFQIGIILFFVINFFKLTSPMKWEKWKKK